MTLQQKPVLAITIISPVISSLSAQTLCSHPGNLGLAFGSKAVQTIDIPRPRRADFCAAGAVDCTDLGGRRRRRHSAKRSACREHLVWLGT